MNAHTYLRLHDHQAVLESLPPIEGPHTEQQAETLAATGIEGARPEKHLCER